ncbi:ATP-dependent DNA helicase [Aquabacterium sp. J223]|uniref:ATP-dependent DNA helicase n=1 Tax=Aquabacterium sp. J223 TaxID=2898431 RepID=UPI0021ADCC58|nr:ATP-dependent DNA helicase [Aquabacterium sp. J223]UUX97014.1 ATP-dependent DNA helicase [Aquabacterium sp. J223]
MIADPLDPGALLAAVQAAFAEDGPLARHEDAYRPREAQLRLAEAVAQALQDRGVLVAEAGTGVGKTFAYLVPLLLSGQRALVSTATKSLQDQLFLRDLPRLRDALQLPVTLALLKGRASYLCLHRLTQAREGATLPDRGAVRALARIEQWSQATRSGDLAELEGLDDRSPLLPLVTSTRENCLGSECPRFRDCHVMKARRDALAADVVVVNHHLFFADIALKDSGVAELLPTVDAAVFDEAHQLAEAGVQFLGSTLSTGQAVDLARDLLAAGLQHARGLAPWSDLAAACERAGRELRLHAAGRLADTRGTIKLRWQERAGSPGLQQALAEVDAAFAAAASAAEMMSELAPDFTRLQQRAAQLAQLARRFTGEAAPNRVRWIDLTPMQARLVEAPLDIRDALTQQRQSGHKAWIFTSATLGDDERLSWFSDRAGLDDGVKLRVGSPFDYPAQARLYVPSRFPKPNEPGHPLAVAALAARCALAGGGRCFVLTTTLRALQQVAGAVQQALDDAGSGIELLVQGASPKRTLLQRFVAAHQPGGPGAVLVGSQSFWEGIDVPGDALQCVLIDKLPFPPPNDPLVEARVKQLEAEGRNAFNDFFVAEAAVSLKQGAGRLIRRETDHGLLVVCDPRMAQMGYGRRLKAALPPMGQVADEAAALDWLAGLTTASTTDPANAAW